MWYLPLVSAGTSEGACSNGGFYTVQQYYVVYCYLARYLPYTYCIAMIHKLLLMNIQVYKIIHG